MKKQKPKDNDRLTRLAVLELLKTDNLESVADEFDVPSDWLHEQRLRFLDGQRELHYPAPVVAEDVVEQPSRWVSFWNGYGRVISIRLLFTAASMLVFYLIPFLLRPFFDPVTGIIVWAGFTALYQLSFASLGVEAVFFVAHRANFDFNNPFVGRGSFDYDTLLKSSELTGYQKCVLNQQKYLAYLLLYCFLVYSLLNQFQGGQAG